MGISFDFIDNAPKVSTLIGTCQNWGGALLKPPVQIFVAYGHNHKLRDLVSETLTRLAEQLGFRIIVKVVTDSLVRTGTGAVGSEVHKTLRAVDAAIILLTSDDYAISKSEFDRIKDFSANVGLNAEELIKRMERRARQNVVYEIGYLNAKIGQERYYIIADEGITPFANLGDVFRTKSFEDNVKNLLNEFLVERLSLKREVSPLYDNDRQIDYSDFIEELENLDDEEILSDFEFEFSELINDDDRILYIYERIVFDSYFQNSTWWRKQISKIKSRDKLRRTLITGLNLVQEYMASWRPPEKKDYSNIRLIVTELTEKILEIEDIGAAPIVRIVLYDYLGLALDKCARRSIETNNIPEAIADWRRSAEALDKVLTLANEFEDEQLPLWRGYAAYNKARVLRRISDYDTAEQFDWMGAFQEAIRFRQKWTQTPVFLPNMIKIGLFTEYLHAKATRIEMRLPDEKGDFAVSDEFVKEAKLEFDEWLAGPDQNRVRLARNVIDTWATLNTSSEGI